VFEHLRSIGCTTTSLLDWDSAPFEFTREEVLRLAEAEHARWWRCMQSLEFGKDEDRVRSKNWGTDYESRTTAFYVDYAELPPENQRKDQDAIRDIPHRLALVGLRPLRK